MHALEASLKAAPARGERADTRKGARPAAAARRAAARRRAS
jgi:hypothetical protein